MQVALLAPVAHQMQRVLVAVGATHDLESLYGNEGLSRQVVHTLLHQQGISLLDVEELVEASDLVLVAVRPADVAGVLAAAGPRLGQRGLVSLAAGVEIGRLRDALPGGARVGRLMPNIAAELGRGVFLLASGTLAELAATLRGALDVIGATVELDEALFDAGTAVSGCMPGYMGYIVDAFAEAGRHEGLDETTARLLAVAGAEGAAAKIAASGDPQSVMAATATPGGMTAAGLDALRRAGVGEGIAAAVAAATARAKELA